MKQTDPMAEDLFEKARAAFFGTAKTSPRPSASSAEPLKPRNDPRPPKSPALDTMSDRFRPARDTELGTVDVCEESHCHQLNEKTGGPGWT